MSKFERLGKYISECDTRNASNQYGLSSLRGVSINKEFIESKANMEGVSLTPYKLVKPNEFCFVTITSRNGEKISLAQNTSDETYIVSSSYIVFRVNDEQELIPDFLYLILSRPEFDRYARFNSWGSAREAFTFESMELTEVCIPSLSEQQKVVNAWKAFREIKEQNEAKAAPLMQLCQSYIQKLKHKYPAQEIGPYISKGKKNSDGKIIKVLGVGQQGFINPQKIPNPNLKNYKIMDKGAICYAPPLYNIKSDAIHLYNFDEPAICSPIYEVFHVDSSRILPFYLLMWLKREEFKRYAEFYSLGVRNTFNYELMEQVKIPLPPLDVQRAIVNIYKCANEAKLIAAEADRLSREVCPALIQHVIHS